MGEYEAAAKYVIPFGCNTEIGVFPDSVQLIALKGMDS